MLSAAPRHSSRMPPFVCLEKRIRTRRGLELRQQKAAFDAIASGSVDCSLLLEKRGGFRWKIFHLLNRRRSSGHDIVVAVNANAEFVARLDHV